MSELIGAGVERAITKLLTGKAQGYGIRCPFNLCFEQGMDGTLAWVVSLRLVPFDQQLVTFCCGEHRQNTYTLIWIIDNACHQSVEMIRHPLNGGRFE